MKKLIFILGVLLIIGCAKRTFDSDIIKLPAFEDKHVVMMLAKTNGALTVEIPGQEIMGPSTNYTLNIHLVNGAMTALSINCEGMGADIDVISSWIVDGKREIHNPEVEFNGSTIDMVRLWRKIGKSNSNFTVSESTAQN